MIILLVSALLNIAARAHSPPTVVKSLPKPADDCAGFFGVIDRATEIINLLALRDPAIQAEFKTDARMTDEDLRVATQARLLTLIYGDQSMFDLRSKAVLAKESVRLGRPLGDRTHADFQDDVRGWWFKPLPHRMRVVTSLLNVMKQSRFRPRQTKGSGLTFLDNFQVERAFKTNHQRLALPNWYFANDGQTARSLFKKLIGAQTRLLEDAELFEMVRRRLAARFGADSLPSVTRVARTFTSDVAEWVDGLPDEVHELGQAIHKKFESNPYSKRCREP